MGPILKRHLEFIQVVYNDIASRVFYLPPLRTDMASRRPTSPCTIRLPTLYVSQRRRETKMSIHIQNIWLRLSFLRKCVVARCQFVRAPSFPAHNFFYWSLTDSWLWFRIKQSWTPMLTVLFSWSRASPCQIVFSHCVGDTSENISRISAQRRIWLYDYQMDYAYVTGQRKRTHIS